MNNQQLAVLLRRYLERINRAKNDIQEFLPQELAQKIQNPIGGFLGSPKEFINYPILDPLEDVINEMGSDIDELLRPMFIKESE